MFRFIVLGFIFLTIVSCAHRDLKAPCTDSFMASFIKNPCGEKQAVNPTGW